MIAAILAPLGKRQAQRPAALADLGGIITVVFRLLAGAVMPEPYQPVDHLAVFRLVPLNSSSNLSVQSRLPAHRRPARHRRTASLAGVRSLVSEQQDRHDDDRNGGGGEQP